MLDALAPADRVAIAAHDAGAANLILAWIAAEPGAYKLLLQGPAAAIWQARFGLLAAQSSIDKALTEVDCLISGTGWSSDLEYDARLAARSRGIRSIAVIDHWVNYRARFSRNGIEVLPDEIWVTDTYALAEAACAIPEVPVRLQPNLYLAEQVASAGPKPLSGDLLFVAEPARDDWGRGTPGEFQALDFLVAHRASAQIDPAVRLRIRPHPSDPAGKYDAWIAAHPGSILDASADIGDALAGAGWVAGLHSFALVAAAAAGRPAISALPPGAPPCVLPHRDIVHLRDLVADQPLSAVVENRG